MKDEETMRDLAARFHKKGWLSKITLRQEKNNLGMQVEWTESGKQVMLSFYNLLDELGYISGARISGEIHVLFELITDKASPDLPENHDVRPVLNDHVYYRMGRSGWATVEKSGGHTKFLAWSEKGLKQKQQFQNILKQMDCTETFVKEFEGIYFFSRACGSSALRQSTGTIETNRRF